MERRDFLSLVIAAPVAGLLVACGASDESSDRASNAPPPTSREVTTDSTTAPESMPSDPPATDLVPTAPAAANAILAYTESGGFTTRRFAIQNPPVVLVSDDGSFLTPAVTTLQFPGPALAQHTTRTITAAGIASLLAAADAAGLLADVEYTRDDNIADASTATLVITTPEGTFTHEAYALGAGARSDTGGTETTPERQHLLDFLGELQSDPAALIGADALGPEAPWVPTRYQLLADPVSDLSVYEPAPTIVAWPADTGVVLADATECVEIERSAVGDLFETATELTLFTASDTTYDVIASPAYPGRSCDG